MDTQRSHNRSVNGLVLAGIGVVAAVGLTACGSSGSGSLSPAASGSKSAQPTAAAGASDSITGPPVMRAARVPAAVLRAALLRAVLVRAVLVRAVRRQTVRAAEQAPAAVVASPSP